MKFGAVPLTTALGTVLAHSVRLPDGTLRKGTVLGAAEISRLSAGQIHSVVVAQLDLDDVNEDIAAHKVALALAGAGLETGSATTGRVNLYAGAAGLLSVDAVRVLAANVVHEGLTIATLLPDTVVIAGQMIATIKIIPYAVPSAALQAVLSAVRGPVAALHVSPWRDCGVGLVLTRTPETRASVLAKMRQSVAKRLEPLGARLLGEQVVAHEATSVTAALRQQLQARSPALLLVSGAAATVDRADVVPAAIVAAGGRVIHAGMPVDPGNLLVLGEIPVGATMVPVVGIPTCARSPKLNGFDFVLRRLVAGIGVTGADIMAMGVGGLLTEIESRPMPRDQRA
ncbi:MAG: molybdopterin-binding protein [Pseudomonadota bacterium]